MLDEVLIKLWHNSQFDVTTMCSYCVCDTAHGDLAVPRSRTSRSGQNASLFQVRFCGIPCCRPFM